MAALFDPSADRRAVLARSFPRAALAATLDELLRVAPAAAIVASPPRFHAEQAIACLRAGLGVLCEKPFATDAASAQAMCDAARSAGRPLAAGHYRRFLPAAEAIRGLIASASLGRLLRVSCHEGGAFHWPAASPDFFRREAAGGGVFLDIGVHVLDLLLWWLGEPSDLDYADDALGGVEVHARLALRWPSGAEGEVILSRDTPTRNEHCLVFERGEVRWRVGAARQLTLTLNGVEHPLASALQPADGRGLPEGAQCFALQTLNLLDALAGRAPLRAPAEEALRGLRLVERAYSACRPLLPPWFSPKERAAAERLASTPRA